MTIIVAAILPETIILAADSKRSASNGKTFEVLKVRAVSRRTVVAKGGFGDLADSIWTAIDGLPEEVRCNPLSLAHHVHRIGATIHQECLSKAKVAGEGDLGLYIFIAGIEEDDNAVLVVVDAGKGQRKEYRSSGPTEVTGMGSVPDALRIAHQAAQAVSDSNEPLPAVDWATEAIRIGQANDPATIGFPGDLAAVTAAGVQWVKLSAIIR